MTSAISDILSLKIWDAVILFKKKYRGNARGNLSSFPNCLNRKKIICIKNE